LASKLTNLLTVFNVDCQPGNLLTPDKKNRKKKRADDDVTSNYSDLVCIMNLFPFFAFRF